MPVFTHTHPEACLPSQDSFCLSPPWSSLFKSPSPRCYCREGGRGQCRFQTVNFSFLESCCLNHPRDHLSVPRSLLLKGQPWQVQVNSLLDWPCGESWAGIGSARRMDPIGKVNHQLLGWMPLSLGDVLRPLVFRKSYKWSLEAFKPVFLRESISQVTGPDPIARSQGRVKRSQQH